MEPESAPEPLFTYAVLRGLFAHVTHALKQPARSAVDHWPAYTVGRFAAWAAAVEGIVELIPEVVQFVPVILTGGALDFDADYEGPLDALKNLVNLAEPPELLLTHRSARVRHMIAHRSTRRCTRLENDLDPMVRAQAQYRYNAPPAQPWWVGILPERPPDQPEIVHFGTFALEMRDGFDWSKEATLLEAFNALAPELSGRIARHYVTPLWGGSTWNQPVWNALLRAPLPLAERRRRAEEAIGDLMLAFGFPRDHYDAIERAIGGCSPQEQRELAPLLEQPRAQLERPLDCEKHALWAPRSRRRPTASGSAQSGPAECPAALLPSGLFERLVHELLHPGPWGEDRFALHPRARWELGRGLDALRAVAGTVQNGDEMLLALADLAALARGESARGSEGAQLALIGLLGALDEADPIFERLASDREPMLREAAVLGLAGTASPLPRRFLDDAVAGVWMAARIATPDAEPWRGALIDDPFSGTSTEQAAALVSPMAELSAALPRVRYRALDATDLARLSRIAAALPAPHGYTLALRLLPERHLHKRLAPLVAAIVNADGGWTAWAAEIEKRLLAARDQALWLGSSLVRFAVKAEWPAGAGAPIPWHAERRWAAARDALERYTRMLRRDKEVADMWLAATASLWPRDRDPLPLPGPWNQSDTDHWVFELIEDMTFGPDWGATQAILEGTRSGFPKPWAWWREVSRVIVRLPESVQLEAALGGFWRDGDFGQWARQTLGHHLFRARTVDQNALHALLADPRLALEHLMPRDRTKHTLFIRRARLAAGLADFAEGLSTLTAIATQAEVEPWAADEMHGWRSRWMDAIQQAMAAGPGGPRGMFVTLAPPGLWEAIDRAFVHSVAHDATADEAQAIARRLAMCGDVDDVPVTRELSERHPTAAQWPELLQALAGRVRDDEL